MKQKLQTLVVLCLLPMFFAPLHAQPEVTPLLQHALSEKDSEEFISVNLRLDEQIDERELYMQSRSFHDREERRTFVVEALKEFSSQRQAALLSYLEDREKAGMVRDIRPLWIGNLVNCEVRPEVIQELMTRKDLARIDYNKERNVLLSESLAMGNPVLQPDNLKTRNLAWNVTLIGADQAWDEGYTGQDVVVAVLDTGVNYNHNDIRDNMWEHPDYPNHGYNFVDDNHNTMDDGGHGTHCAGTVAGTGASGTGTGIAPDAIIMNLKVLQGNGSGTEAGVWAAIQFAVDYGAHVMSLSLGWQHQWGPDRSMWRTVMDNALCAGVIASVAAGNEGGWGGEPPPNEVRTPGDVPPPWTHPDQTEEGGNSAVVTAGATTNNDNLASFSSKGPVTWQNDAPFNDYAYNPGTGLIKPDVAAPGANITSLSHSNNTGYTTMSGTSMAAPAVAGVMALMISKDPNILPEEINQILEETAVPHTDNKSNTYGSGRVDALAALMEVTARGVRYVSHELDDSQGNGDGNINPGEQILLDVSLENFSEEPVEDVQAELSVESPYITLLDHTASLGDFTPGETKSFDGIFSFEAAENIPGKHKVRFVITAFAAGDPEKTWTGNFTETAHAPLLEFTDMYVLGKEDTAASLLPGQTADLVLEVTNTGQLPSDDIHVMMESTEMWVFVHGAEGVDLPALQPGESENVVFTISTLLTTPPDSFIDLLLIANSGVHSFEWIKQVAVGKAPVYTYGDIPSTYGSAEPDTSSSALEPGEMTVSIPYGAIITSVSVEYALTSRNGAWMSEQRSFLRCVSPGGETEHQVYSGQGNTVGTIDYNRSGLDIANNVTGGGDIEFELHAFHSWEGWGGLWGSTTDFVFVPDGTWKLIVYYELPEHDVTFFVKTQAGKGIEGAQIEVFGVTVETDDSGHAVFSLPEGPSLYNAMAVGYMDIYNEPFEVTGGDDHVEVLLQLHGVPGDANGDEVVDFLDVVAIVQYFEGDKPEPFYFENADVNQDGEINLLDVIATANIFAGGRASPYDAMQPQPAELHMHHDGISLHSDGSLTGIQFELSTTEQFQDMQLHLPGHELVLSHEEESLRVMVYSPTNTPIPEGEIKIISFGQREQLPEWTDAFGGYLNAGKVPVATHHD